MTTPIIDPIATPPRPPSHVEVVWRSEHLFDTGRPHGPRTLIDGHGKHAQSPPDALLSALASCSGVDVVDILAKRRTPVEALTIDVIGERREHPPRRFEKIHLTFHITGADVERVHAERAVALAFEKYCSVAASLAPDIVVTTTVDLNGTAGESIRQSMLAPAV